MTKNKKQKVAHIAEREMLRNVGRYFHDRGWSLGASSNYSLVVSREPLVLVVTASGKDKGALRKNDFAIVDEAGQPIDDQQPKASTETMLHVVLAQHRHVGCVLHTHSIWGTLLSDLAFGAGQLEISDDQMLKGLAGIDSHAATVAIKIYDNTQDIEALAQQISSDLTANEPGVAHGFLIRGHGLYTWGRNLAEAKRHIEVLEFLFEVTGRKLTLTSTSIAG
jgi:methylthioribulose-1-phosphate dehydratase